jgi:methyl-accepting chemotaxis protein
MSSPQAAAPAAPPLPSPRLLVLRGVGAFFGWSLPVSVVAAYLAALTLGLVGDENWRVVGTLLPGILLVQGLLYPLAVMHRFTSRALAAPAGERPGARLVRLLRLPWKAALTMAAGAWVSGGLVFGVVVCHWMDKEPWRAALATLVATCFGVMVSFPVGLSLEKLVRPLALAEQARHPGLQVRGWGPFWPRLSWFLPLTTVASLLCALVLSACVLTVKLVGMHAALRAELGAGAGAAGAAGALARLEGLSGALASELLSAAAWVCALVLVLPTVTAWRLARRQAQGARAVGAAVAELAAGRVRAPAWVATDELGGLAAGMGGVLESLRGLAGRLHASAGQLAAAGAQLSVGNTEQSRAVALQASVLAQVRATATEFQRTSEVAAARAGAVLEVSGRAAGLGEEGGARVEEGLAGLASIQEAVAAIGGRLAALERAAAQIGSITTAVRSLADRTQVLSLNASIEATRAGEHGRGFGVVSREMRALAGQSREATGRIHAVLAEVAAAVREAAQAGEAGGVRLAAGVEQVHGSGEALRALAALSREQAEAARQIASAVSQQAAGHAQLLSAMAELSRLTDATQQRLAESQEAAGVLAAVSGEVTTLAGRLSRG